MIIIQLAGGLGNQMFQYALYLQLKSLGKDVKIDDRTGFEHDMQRNPALAPFGITYETATAKEMECMLDASPHMCDKIRRKLFGRNKKSYFEADKRYKPEILAWDDIYLEGYWQTEKYFERVSEEVRKAYDVEKLLSYVRGKGAKEMQEPEESEALFEKYLAQITLEESISVHIRGGDYLLPENQKLFGGICTEAYYKKAMEQMKKEHPHGRFYLFTNDKQWTMQQIVQGGQISQGEKAGDVEIIDLGGQSDYQEFILMSKCRHHILANSSFSWWASYLNGNPDKTVYAPDRWLNGWDCTDFYRKDMRRIAANSGETEETTIHE
ncbi:MAG: alpha-1,2-fucosyltransferase [Lachnospiraceae bacterium]|nr:alpha-1,2-fucosyltransferase [Lachnospiraceae bacterium]